MDFNLIDVAYGALLHDIGKFYQRIYTSSNLTDEELATTPINPIGGYHDHLHSGYTSRFIRKYLNLYNEFEKLTSEHHKNDLDLFVNIIKKADHISSAIDRQDELDDQDVKNKRGYFITARLNSVLSEVVFDKNKMDMTFPLTTLMNMNMPIGNFEPKNLQESAEEYRKLFKQFCEEVDENIYLKNRVDRISYLYMYNLMNKYLVTIPASTYGGVKSSVSLYDHLKLTSAIASCLYNEECYKTEKFYMLEIDISGIQSFIYQVTEGNSTKKGLSKALRGRSALVGLITNAVSYAFLNEFGLTESNILFNTGGGSMILLPACQDTIQKVEKISKQIRRHLFEIFQTDITFVNAIIELTAEELEAFQSEKAIELKQLLGRNKMKKFSDVINLEFFYEKISDNEECRKCGRVLIDGKCKVCDDVEIVSNVYTKNDSFGIVYDFSNQEEIDYIEKIDFGFVKLLFVSKPEVIKMNENLYVDSINQFGFGNQRLISNLVPIDLNGDILNFEEIIKLTPQKYGDEKLAILKMDVDNLGGIFAFGLKKTNDTRTQRSISKYVTMSRLMEYFFGNEIKHICTDVTNKICTNIGEKVINDTMFYINYAGGDDLVIIGSVYSIIQLSSEINKRFSQFTGNDNITISGGIHIQNDKKPTRFGIQEAEKQLEMSKTGDKNAMTLIDTTISFKEYESLLNGVNELCELINDGRVSRTLIYNVMSFVKDKDYQNYIYLVPRLQYTLFRNIDQKKNGEVLELMRKLINNVKTDDDVKKMVLKLKLSILFTRDNKEE